MEKIKQNTNCRRWASLWLVIAMAVMTAIFLRGGVVVQAEESDEAICVNTSYVVNGIEYDNEYDIPDLSVDDEVTFKVSATGGVGDIRYEWYYQAEDNKDELLKNETQNTLTVSKTKKITEIYYCKVIDEEGKSDIKWFHIPSVKTLTVTGYINDEYEENNTIEAEKNASIKLRIDAETTEESDLTYTWYYYNPYESTKQLSDKDNKTEITVEKQPTNEEYYCVISDGVNSKEYHFYLNLKNTVTINNTSYIIKGKEYDEEDLPELSENDEITLGVQAESSVGKITYQWYRWEKNNNIEWEGDWGNYNPIDGETNSTLTVKKEDLRSESYCCRISDEENSNTAYFTVPAIKTLTIKQYVKKQDADEKESSQITAKKGTSVTLRVDATSKAGNDKITYQWYDLSSYEAIEGATEATYTVEKSDKEYENYYCSVNDTVNNTQCYFYLGLENTIKNTKKYINDKEYDGWGVEVKEGKKCRLSVKTISTYENATYTYKWYRYKNRDEKEMLGTNSEISVTKTKAKNDTYYVEITNDEGSRVTVDFSLGRKMNISILSYINGKYNNAGCEYEIGNGQTAELSVDVKSESEDITYDWQKYDTDEYCYVSTGKTENTYITEPITSEGRYMCIITCDGYETEEEFVLKAKEEEKPDDGLALSQYIIINGRKEEKNSAIVDRDTKVIFGVEITNLPETINESDISYEWYEATDEDRGDEVLSEEKECEVSVKSYQGYVCTINVNGEYRESRYFYVKMNPDIITEISLDGKLIDDSIEVDSFEELYGKKLSVKASNKLNGNDKFSYQWYQEGEEQNKVLSNTNEVILTKDILSGTEVELYCKVTNEKNISSNEYIYLTVHDYVSDAKTYINDEETDKGQFASGEKATLKVKIPDKVSNKMTYEWYDEDGNKMKCQKSEYTITKNNEEEVYICVVTDQNERLREYEFTLYPETGFVPRGYINGKAGNTSTVEANSTIKLEVKVKSEEGVTYQWYSASGDFVEDKLEGETTPVLSVAIAKESEEYQCLVTKGNERKWVYFELEVCDHTDIEVLPAVPATCEKDGLTEGKRCKECGETIVEQEVVKATGHKWDNGIITKPATATETGVKTFTCTVCKKTKTEVIQKLTTNNTVNNDTTKKPETIETSLKTGTKVTDKKSKAVYKVTGDNTVQYTKASGKKVRKAKKVAIPAAVTVNGVKYQVTAIAPNAFKNNKNLKTIIIPATVRSIGKQAFAGCKNLKSIIIRTPYLTKKSVGAKAFKGISSKAVIKVPKKQLKAYKKLLKTKGVAKSVKIK